ncbi:MAG: hypothetical protein ACPGJV_12135 [Bacteriovoracaceae bacterium]
MGKRLELIRLILIISFLSLFPVSLLAQSSTSSQSAVIGNLRFNYESVDWEYREFTGSGDELMKDYGKLTGFSSELQGQVGFLQLTSSYRYLSGSTRYEGGLQDSNGNYAGDYDTDSKNKIVNYELGIHRVYDIGAGQVWTMGIGYYIRKLDNPELPSDPYDYSRYATYKTIPFTLKYVNKSFDFFRFEAIAKLHTFFKGETDTRSSEVNPESTDVVFQQPNGRGLELKLNSFFNTGYGRLMFGAYGTFWSVEDSDYEPVPGSDSLIRYEPENKTSVIGFNVGLAY